MRRRLIASQGSGVPGRLESACGCAARAVRRSAQIACKVRAALLAIVLLSAAPGSSFGQGGSDIASRARQIAAERSQLQAQGRLDAPAEGALIERLGALVLAFIEDSDQAARSGSSAESRLRPVFEAVHEPLAGIYSRHSTHLDRMARQIMDVDGDLEALYETREWKDSQLVAAKALYYLNWLNYYGARLYEGERRKELLQAAEKGFSEFAIGERKTDLLTESLLGRALCHLELGNYEWAIRDLQIVLEEPNVSADRKAKARLGLLEAYVRGGKTTEALRYSQRLLDGGTVGPGELPAVRYLRLQVLFDVVKRSSAAEAERHRRETVRVMDELRRAGRGWAERVDALMVSSIEDPSKWAGKAETPFAKWQLAKMLLQQGNDAQAVPLLEQLVASQAGEAKRHRAEAHYLLGVSKFKMGDYMAAADHLDAALGGRGTGEFASEAMYLRFKALEARMAEEPAEALALRYEAAIRALVDSHPGHASAHEARYRLGELLQARGEFAEAVEQYAAVKNDPGFELRAAFATLQSDFELLKTASTAPEREDRLARIAGHLDQFWARCRAYEKSKGRGEMPLEQFQATATLFQAVHLSLLRDVSHDTEIAQLLAGFEQRYPRQQDLFPQVLRLRLGSLQRLGNFAEARRLVSDKAPVLVQDGRMDLVEKLANGFAKAGARTKARGDEPAGTAAEQVAARLLELLPEEESTSGKRKLMLARLYQSTGQLDRAEETYEDMVRQNGAPLAALRGLAEIAEKREDFDGASRYWGRYSGAVRPGDAPWYEAQYQQARLMMERGNKSRSCEMLKELRPAMPGLGDADLRQRLSELYEQTCG